jgi:hypothetical protein
LHSKKKPGLGLRIDITLTIVHLGFFFSDTEIVINKAEKCVVSPFLLSFWLTYLFAD